ncbi:VWA domain-containing protein, partial [Lutibacter sp.]
MNKILLNIILIGIIALLLALFQYVFKSKKNRLNSILAFLRFFTYFLILLVLLNPSIKKNSIKTTKPILAVAIDNSKSINYNAQTNNIKNFVALLKNNTTLNKKFTINYYSFGNNLKVLDSLSFNENQTNLAVPFQEFSKLYNKALAPVIIISDGNQTVGNSLEFIEYKNPVFPFIVGDTTVYKDIYIKQLNVNKFTNINNKFPVELFVNYTGTKSISKKLSVYHKGTKVYSKKLHFSKSETIKNESFFLTAASKGTQYYTVVIEELDKEQNTINNTKSFSINVLEEKSKILILTSIIHPDLGMLKKSIESNKQYSATISNITNLKNNISDYQLIILNQPTKEFKGVFEEISSKKLNYFIISGLSTDWEFLNRIQPNFKKNRLSQTENYYPVFNATYASYFNKDIGFSNFAPLTDSFGDILFSIPYNTLLFQQIEAIKTEKPLLATFENNNQRAAILLGENSWKWRMNSYVENNTFEYFDNFMSNLIQYLSSNKKNKQLSVSIEPIYYSNESIQISASFLDKNFNFDSRAKLWITVSNKKKNYLQKLPFSLFQSAFFVELPNLPADEYVYVVSVENQDTILSGSF